MGDAAHPVIPFRALGGNNALLDVIKLSEELCSLLRLENVTVSDISKALGRYENEMGPRGKAARVESRKAGDMIHTTNNTQRIFTNKILSIVSWKMNASPAERWAFRIVAFGVIGSITAFVACKIYSL